MVVMRDVAVRVRVMSCGFAVDPRWRGVGLEGLRRAARADRLQHHSLLPPPCCRAPRWTDAGSCTA